jgi:serine/threonine protein kinase
MIEGMTHLLSKKVLHRDLKLANIFLHFPRMNDKSDLITNKWLKEVNLLEEDF